MKEKNDLGLKIVSLFLAIFLWSYVMSEVNPEIIKKYPVELQFSNKEELEREGLTTEDIEETKVIVKVEGKKSDLDDFNVESLNAFADLSGYTEGQRKVPINVTMKDQMSNVKIVDYEPKEILITFEKTISEERPIEVKTIGNLPEGYVLGEVKPELDRILLKGPRAWLNEVDKVVAFVDVENRTKSFSVVTPIRLLDSEGNDVTGIEKYPDSIELDIPIMRAKEVEIKLNIEGELPEGLEERQLLLDPKTITLKGDDSIVNLTHIDTKKVSIDDLLREKELEVELDIPEGINVVGNIDKVRVLYDVSETTLEKDFNIDYNEISIENLDSNYDLNFIQEETIALKVVGPTNLVNNLESQDIKLSLDLINLEAGNHNISLEVVLPENISIKELSPKSIEIELIKKE